MPGHPVFSRHLILVAVVGVGLLGLGGYLGGRHLWAWSHYRAAERALERRDFPQARDHLADCLSVWPRSASTHLLAARTARRAYRLDEAVEHLEACEQLGGPAEAMALERDLLQAQNGQFAQVEKKLLACLDQDHPDSVLILEVLTWQWMREHRLDRAQAYLDLWLKRWPKDREALIRAGWVREHLLDYQEALTAYGKALAVDPEQDRAEHDRVRLRLAQLLLQRKRPRTAVDHFVILYRRQPANPDVLLGLARCRALLRQPDEARRLLDALLARRPRDGHALAERGKLALAAGQVRAAERWLRQAVTIRPRDREIVYNFYRCLEKAGKNDEADQYLARFREISADERRMNRLMQEIARAPQDAELRYQAGRIFLRNGFPEDAVRWLGLALASDPRHAGAHQALADYYESVGKPDQAAEHREILQRLGVRGAGRSNRR